MPHSPSACRTLSRPQTRAPDNCTTIANLAGIDDVAAIGPATTASATQTRCTSTPSTESPDALSRQPSIIKRGCSVHAARSPARTASWSAHTVRPSARTVRSSERTETSPARTVRSSVRAARSSARTARWPARTVRSTYITIWLASGHSLPDHPLNRKQIHALTIRSARPNARIMHLFPHFMNALLKPAVPGDDEPGMRRECSRLARAPDMETGKPSSERFVVR